MRLEVVCALLAVASVTIRTSAEDSGSPWRSYVDDERSVRDALDSSRPWRSYVDDERSVRDAVDDDDGQSVLGSNDGRSIRDDIFTACNIYH